MAESEVPAEAPPPIDRVVATYDWSAEADRDIDASTSISGGRLIMMGHGPSSIHGYTPHELVERDVVIDLVADLSALHADEGFGVFVRRNAADRYIGLRVTPAGVIAISAFDGTEQPIGIGPLAEGMVLHEGRNRVTVAAIGPSITLSLNSMVVTSILVDPRFVDGYCGFLLEQRHDAMSRVAVEWCQIRHIW